MTINKMLRLQCHYQ